MRQRPCLFFPGPSSPREIQPLSWAGYPDGNTGLPLAFVREEFRPWNFINLRPRGIRKQKCNM